jgi:hypothetical protein
LPTLAYNFRQSKIAHDVFMLAILGITRERHGAAGRHAYTLKVAVAILEQDAKVLTFKYHSFWVLKS